MYCFFLLVMYLVFFEFRSPSHFGFWTLFCYLLSMGLFYRFMFSVDVVHELLLVLNKVLMVHADDYIYHKTFGSIDTLVLVCEM